MKKPDRVLKSVRFKLTKMNIEQLYQYSQSKKAVTEHFPFDNDTLVFKVLGKMFLLTSLKGWEENTPSLNLKCEPDYAQQLRAEYESIEPGFHMNKKHWNTVRLYTGELQDKLVFELIDHSYDMVVKSMPKKQRKPLL